MKRSLVQTEDGSYTLHVPELGEHYHSIHGALTESMYVFIHAGLNFQSGQKLRILEYGMGTGLNAFLAWKQSSKEKHIYYYTIEKYPLNENEYTRINPGGSDENIFQVIHSSPWEQDVKIDDFFTLHKERADFRVPRDLDPFDVVFFDAFAPDVQPDLWTLAIFRDIYQLCKDGAVFCTYSVKGSVRRKLTEAGFMVEKIPGPPHKREILRAIKLA